ncbi:MAG: hypothetical protein DWI18_01070 [Planctomycetota bacterium]|nr:MAG: hypothetical protein DWI18_01070 [Planctomycetota bacterium]
MKLSSCAWTWMEREFVPHIWHARSVGRTSTSFAFRAVGIFASMGVVCAISACAVSAGKDPMKSLSNPGSLPVVQVAAMEKLDLEPSPEYISALKRIMWQPGFAESTRLEAFVRLVKLDEPGLKEIVRLQLPKLMALAWRQKLCELIVEHHWVDMTPTLVRAWSVPMAAWIEQDKDRPERIAIEQLNGKDQLTDLLVKMLVESNPITEANLRLRCWEMLQKIGQRERLVKLLADASVKPDDRLLSNLRSCAGELGIVPTTKEEILWLQALLETKNIAFWAQAKAATMQLPPDVRAKLEIRELPIAVAVSTFKPELLSKTPAELYQLVDARRQAKGSRIVSPSFEGYGGDHTENLYEMRNKLSWGDLASMAIAMEIFDSPILCQQIFDLADRDMADRDTEFGGVIRIKSDGKPSIEEMKPRVQGNDLRYEASQKMFDNAYTGLFHFHLHCQSYDNMQYAGPHLGDFAYAESTRANCLVFSFVSRKELNVDFYRHGPRVVDLGCITRPKKEG